MSVQREKRGERGRRGAISVATTFRYSPRSVLTDLDPVRYQHQMFVVSILLMVVRLIAPML
jgi:hypothetical protein